MCLYIDNIYPGGVYYLYSVCGCVPYFCRTVYDGDESEQFLESLNARIKVHDKDIERMCNKNYQGFIESVSELLKVKSDASKLKVT